MNWNESKKLNCQVQNYAWGTFGEEAYLNQLLGGPCDDKPKAELWMGAHPKAPSQIDGENLNQLLEQHAEEILGKTSLQKWGKQLPYLFKVLCANEALSIQLHPNKQEAEELHAKDPKNYPDDNHKPEIAIALDQLEALIGFEAYPKLIEDLKNYPEVTNFFGKDLFSNMQDALLENETTQLKALKEAFMQLNLKALSNKASLKDLNEQLYHRLGEKPELTPKETWYLKLFPKYSDGDVGLFVLFFFKLQSTAKRGSCLFKSRCTTRLFKGQYHGVHGQFRQRCQSWTHSKVC